MDEIGAELVVSSMTAAEGVAYLLHECPADEPVFILRGQDILAPGAVFAWAHSAERHGVSLKKLAGAWRAAEKMLTWNTRRMPD